MIWFFIVLIVYILIGLTICFFIIRSGSHFIETGNEVYLITLFYPFIGLLIFFMRAGEWFYNWVSDLPR